MVATETGGTTAYAIMDLQERGRLFVEPGTRVYEGQVVGEHCKDNDLEINLVINKKLSNVRASGSDDAAKIKPMRQMSLEACLEYIESDELVEITPNFIRMRKRWLTENERKRNS